MINLDDRIDYIALNWKDIKIRNEEVNVLADQLEEEGDCRGLILRLIDKNTYLDPRDMLRYCQAYEKIFPLVSCWAIQENEYLCGYLCGNSYIPHKIKALQLLDKKLLFDGMDWWEKKFIRYWQRDAEEIPRECRISMIWRHCII